MSDKIEVYTAFTRHERAQLKSLTGIVDFVFGDRVERAKWMAAGIRYGKPECDPKVYRVTIEEVK